MYLQRIKIKNFKSIYDELELDFQNDIKGFWKINGTVGAGKTSIGESIIFGLYGDVKGKNNADLISWGEKQSIIEVWCTSKGHSLYIKRVINRQGSSPIYVEVDGEELIFTNKKNAQYQLEEEYYDISRVTLELLCIISFNNFKSIANLNTRDTKQFLDQVFGFYILTNYGDICKLKKQEIIEGRTSQILKRNNIEDQINRLEKLSNIELIEGNIEELNKELSNIKEKHKQLKQDRSYIDNDYKEKLVELKSKLTEIKTLGTNLKKEIDFIKKGVCPTCGAKIDQSKLEEKETNRNLLLSSFNGINERINILNDAYNLNKSKYDQLERSYNEQITEISSKISKLKEQEKRIKISQDEINNLKLEAGDLEKSINQYNIEENDWNILYETITTNVKQRILLSFIPILNKSISEYTVQFQLPYLIKFDESFNCNINLFGNNQDIPISSLSTGQTKVVNISIILGILKTIINSVNFNICLLDELLSNMHAELRHDICRVLKQDISNNQTIFIISHAELDDQYFDGSLDVELIKDDNCQKSIYTKNNLN